MDFIVHSNIDGSCQNGGNLHLNRKETAVVVKNLCRFVKSMVLD